MYDVLILNGHMRPISGKYLSNPHFHHCFFTWSIWFGTPGFCPWHPRSPCLGISLAGCRQRRNIHQELRWWQQAGNPSSLQPEWERQSNWIHTDCPIKAVTRRAASRTCGGSQCQSFGDVANGLDAAIGDDRHAEPPGVLGDLVHCRRLGTATRQHCRGGVQRMLAWRKYPQAADHRQSHACHLSCCFIFFPNIMTACLMGWLFSAKKALFPNLYQ